MSDEKSNKRLGRGLAALIGEMDKPNPELPFEQPVDKDLPIELIVRSPNNPRRHFDEDDLRELGQSIAEHGLIQPIVVRPLPANGGEAQYEIIAGERRWRAAQSAGLTNVPVIIRDVDDKAALELAIIENVQRSDLDAVEEALGYQQLIDEHGYTQADLGQVVAKSRSHVANTLRLLKLPKSVQQMISDGSLSAGHARTLVTAADPEKLAERIVSEGFSVRQAETLAAAPLGGSSKGKKATAKKDANTLALEKTMSDILGLKVQINHNDRGGDIRVQYKTLDQLDEICRLLQAS